MAKSGLIIKNSKVAFVNGVYDSYTQDNNGPRWISHDNTCLLRFINQIQYKNVDIDYNQLVTSDMLTKSHYVYDGITEQYSPIDLLMSTNDTIADQIGINRKTLVADHDRSLTEEEISLGEANKRIYWLVDVDDTDFETAVQVPTENLSTISTVVNDSGKTSQLFYSEPDKILCVGESMNRWAISRITITDTSTTIHEDLYCAFADNNTIAPYSKLTWIRITAESGSVDNVIKIEYWDESSIQATTETFVDSDGAKRTVTTFVNVVTGDTHTETSIVREKEVSNPVDVKRYDYINLAIGKVYRFRFASEFASLGWIPGDESQPIDAGIYKVDGIMSYYDSITSHIDLYDNLYEPCNVPRSTFDDDQKRLADTIVYRLVKPDDTSIVYFMPQIYIEGQPDASVLRYNKLLLMIDLGIQPNADTVKSLSGNTHHSTIAALNNLDDMGEVIKKVLEKEYGMTPTESNPLLKYSVYGQTWLTDDGFDSISAEREARKAQSTVDLNTLFNCNDSNEWYRKNLELEAKIKNQSILIQRLLEKRAED